MKSSLIKIFHFRNKLSMVSSPLVKRKPWSFPLPLIKIYLYFLRDLPHGMVLNNYFLRDLPHGMVLDNFDKFYGLGTTPSTASFHNETTTNDLITLA